MHDITNQAILHNVMQSSQGNHVKVNGWVIKHYIVTIVMNSTQYYTL